MTSNSARKRTIRALAEAEGISYTTALRKYGAETDENGKERRPCLPLYLNGFALMAFMGLDGIWHADVNQVTSDHDLARFGRWVPWCNPEDDSAPLDPEVAAARTVLGRGLDLCSTCFGSKSDRKADAQLAFLGQIFGAIPVEPLPTKAWTVAFQMRDDMSMPYNLEVTTGGLVMQQSFWRGEKFQILGFTEDVDVHDITHTWRAVQDAPSLAVGCFPVISDIDGKWSTWAEQVREITEHDAASVESGITATVTTYNNELPGCRFRVDEFYAALADADHQALALNDLVADDRVSGLVLRAAVARGDVGASRITTWAETMYDNDPEYWDEQEPFTVSFDTAEVAAWRANARLYPSQR